MRNATLQEERKLRKKGYKNIACLDEVGRGALAGPVVAAAVMTGPKFQTPNTKFQLSSNYRNSKCLEFETWYLELGALKLRDSKKLSPKARIQLYKILTSHPNIKWGIGRVYPRVIDRINIFEATKLAMKRAVENLSAKLQIVNCQIDFLILDGLMRLPLDIPQKAVVKADEKFFSCAAASIIAKVKRDRQMKRYDKKFPEYGFNRHKGYGTREHIKMLKKLGRCAIHRNSFNYHGRT